jgi:hypothetical protein
MPDLSRAEQLIALRREWRAHLQGQLAFATTVWSHFGRSSQTGRKLDRYVVLNSSALLAIDEMIELECGVRPGSFTMPPAPSIAAKTMLAARPERTSKTLHDLTEPQWAAVRAYALERVMILQTTVKLRLDAGLAPTPTLQRELSHWSDVRSALLRAQAATQGGNRLRSG